MKRKRKRSEPEVDPGLLLVAVGLGTARLVGWGTEAFPGATRLVKAATAAGVATGGSVGLTWRSGWKTKVIVAAGANGVAMVTHQLTSSMRSKKDIDRLALRKNLGR